MVYKIISFNTLCSLISLSKTVNLLLTKLVNMEIQARIFTPIHVMGITESKMSAGVRIEVKQICLAYRRRKMSIVFTQV
ncbi:hypothetical protein NUACC21_44120 [Scytonema sp. NUACC21]